MIYLSPQNLKEVFSGIKDALKSEKNYGRSDSSVRYIAGGTDLAVLIAEKLVCPDILVDISSVTELTRIEENAESIRIGSAVTIDEIALSAFLPRCLTVGAHSIGSPQIRNLATIGGNICNASPCGDTLTPLLVLDADLELESESGSRFVHAEDFFTGSKRNVLKGLEILKTIRIKKEYLKNRSFFRKIGKRNAQIISQVNTALYLEFKGNGEIKTVRAAAGSVAPVPLRLKNLEKYLKGRKISGIDTSGLFDAVNSDIKPISDLRASADYRRRVTGSLIYETLQEAARDN